MNDGRRRPTRRTRSRQPVNFLRVTAEMKLTSTQEVLKSRVFLTDLTPAGVGLFVNTSVSKGEKVSLVIEQPRHLFVQGEVLWCSPYSLQTKVLGEESFRYRIGIRFSFKTPDEKKAIEAYCVELDELLHPKAA